MIDLSTILLIASVLFGSVVADSVLFGKAFRVDFTVPNSVATDGLSAVSAEKVFISEFAKVGSIQYVIPFPDITDGMEDSVLSVLAKPLHLDAAVEVLQRKITSANFSVTLSMMKGPGDGELTLHAFVQPPSGELQRYSVSGSSKDPTSLIVAMANKLAYELMPYRLATYIYATGLKGEVGALERAEQVAQRALTENKELQQGAVVDMASRRVMLHNALGLIDLVKGNAEAAARHLDEARRIPSPWSTPHAIVAANQAFVALSRKDAAQARRFLHEAKALRSMPYSHHFDNDLRVLEALLLWAEGKPQEADKLLEYGVGEAIREAPSYYRSRIAIQQGRAAAAAELERQATVSAPMAQFHPDLAQAAFWLDPPTGTLVRRRR